ncbi:MAG: DUF2029 domain-containing protein, partial [Pseudolabrys sp.]|nr:DUF2029 domain-containing protein [Pseudolabrys sp.]
TIGGYLYWPSFLVLLRPLIALDDTTAALIGMAVSAALLSLAAYILVRTTFAARTTRQVIGTTGVLLMCNIPSAWFNFKYVQGQTGMTACMMLAAAAMMRSRWRGASFWLFLSMAIKPLSIVMLLLSGAVRPRMRLWCACALLAVLALPYLVADAAYVTSQYQAWAQKMSKLTAVKPIEWEMQADFASMLAAVHITLPPLVSVVVRALGALGTLALAWRIAATQPPRVVALAVLILSACFITLFGPRNETISFLVLNPALTVLAFILIEQDTADRRGWILLAAVIVLGVEGPYAVFTVLKPAIVCLIFGWLVWLTVQPARWRDAIRVNGPAADSVG